MLFQNACEYKFDAFNALPRNLELSPPKEELGEAYLLRAQIKLYAADDTISDDLSVVAVCERQ